MPQIVSGGAVWQQSVKQHAKLWSQIQFFWESSTKSDDAFESQKFQEFNLGKEGGPCLQLPSSLMDTGGKKNHKTAEVNLCDYSQELTPALT